MDWLSLVWAIIVIRECVSKRYGIIIITTKMYIALMMYCHTFD